MRLQLAHVMGSCARTSVRVRSYQSPEPAFFTMDVPTLDGGKRHRVGVLETEGREGRGRNLIQRTHMCQFMTSKTTRYIPDQQYQTTNHGMTQPTATEPLSKAAWGASEPATCTHTRTRYRAGNEQRRRGSRQREDRMREKAVNEPNRMGALFFSSRKEQRDEEGEEGGRRGWERRREGVPYPP